MPIIELQRSIAEIGRIRIGQQVPTSGGRTRPAKLETFRLTSADRRRIEQAAELYGGKVAEWASPNGKQWEVITERDVLDVVVPPESLSFSQNYELWSAGGCQRRCDGINETIGQQPCVCDPAARECDIHTRLSVLLRDLPGLGVWRLDTQGWYAAKELAGALEIIAIAAGTRLLPARLRLDQRSVKRPGKDGKPETRRFAVPVLDVEVTPALLLAGGQGEALALAAAPKEMTPVPAEAGEGRTVAEQSAPPAAKPKRANSAPPIPPSGRRRGAAAGAEQPEPTVGTPHAPADAEAEADGGHAAGGAEPEAGHGSPASGASATRRRSTSCTHPADSREEIEAGTICRLCGTLLVETTDPEPEPASTPVSEPARAKEPGEAGYWQARLHAVAAERGIDHEGLRAIAGAVKRIPPDELSGFSLRDLEDATAEGLDKLIRQFPTALDVDAATEWVAKVADARGLATWEAIDPLAVAALPRSLDEATVGDWIAFGLRLHAGEYDPPAEPEPDPEPTPKARSRRAATKED